MPTALIIGASRGLGRALVEEHLRRGWDVVATVRRADALADIDSPSLQVEIVDVTDWAGVDALRQRLAGRSFDLLFVNAGVSGPSTVPIGDADADAFTELMLTNVLAPLRLIDRFADLVAPQGTVAAMSSILGSIGENGHGTWEAYRTSKAALNMGLVSIWRRRADTRTYLLLHPGWVQTEMGGPGAMLTVEQSIPPLVDVLEQRAGRGGIAYVDYQGRDIAW